MCCVRGWPGVAETPAPLMAPRPVTTVPDFSALVSHWLRLAGDGRVLALSPALAAGDAVKLSGEDAVRIAGGRQAEVLVFDLPQ